MVALLNLGVQELVSQFLEFALLARVERVVVGVCVAASRWRVAPTLTANGGWHRVICILWPPEERNLRDVPYFTSILVVIQLQVFKVVFQ